MKKKKLFKEKMFLQKREISQREKGMNDPSRRKILPRFVIPHPVSFGQEWYVVKHKKFP